MAASRNSRSDNASPAAVRARPRARRWSRWLTTSTPAARHVLDRGSWGRRARATPARPVGAGAVPITATRVGQVGEGARAQQSRQHARAHRVDRHEPCRRGRRRPGPRHRWPPARPRRSLPCTTGSDGGWSATSIAASSEHVERRAPGRPSADRDDVGRARLDREASVAPAPLRHPCGPGAERSTGPSASRASASVTAAVTRHAADVPIGCSNSKNTKCTAPSTHSGRSTSYVVQRPARSVAHHELRRQSAGGPDRDDQPQRSRSARGPVVDAHRQPSLHQERRGRLPAGGGADRSRRSSTPPTWGPTPPPAPSRSASTASRPPSPLSTPTAAIACVPLGVGVGHGRSSRPGDGRPHVQHRLRRRPTARARSARFAAETTQPSTANTASPTASESSTTMRSPPGRRAMLRDARNDATCGRALVRFTPPPARHEREDPHREQARSQRDEPGGEQRQASDAAAAELVDAGHRQRDHRGVDRGRPDEAGAPSPSTTQLVEHRRGQDAARRERGGDRAAEEADERARRARPARA